VATAIDRKVVIVTRKTRLEELIDRFNTREQARFYVSRSRENSDIARGVHPEQARKAGVEEFADYEDEDDRYRNALKYLRSHLEGHYKVHVIERSLLPNFLFGPDDIIVPVGQDGLVANTAKYALGHPIIGVNPDKKRFDGILLPYDEVTAVAAIEQTLAAKTQIKAVTLAEASLNDGQRLVAFNDLFIGARSHVSARYRIKIADLCEDQSSSGVLVSTGAGSTGWLSSVWNMAYKIQETSGGAIERPAPMEWDSNRLCYVVREPFCSKVSQANIVVGYIENNKALIIESKMPANGVIFSDGVESDFVAFNAGAIVSIQIAKERAMLVL
jgi:NAD kinase